MTGHTTSRLGRPGLAVFLASMVCAFLVLPLTAQTNSGARIVRLSFVDGTVSLQRPGVSVWAKAFVNTPIQQGFSLASDTNSFAEVEFENGSTARLGQMASLRFTELSLGPDGSKINRMSLAQGYGTFSVLPEHGDLFQVDTSQGSFTADGKAIFRIDLDQGGMRLEVFKGHVQVQSQYGQGRISGKHVVEIRPGDSEQAYRVTHGITRDAWDSWVAQRDGTLEASRAASGYRSASAFGAPYGSLYGWNDLYYYGNWTDLPGYGYGWFPYVAGGWMPYTMGSWAFYPGFGYTWISSMSWGWLPFHYGNWVFVGGYGWGWLPGNFGSWSPAVVNWYQGPGWIGWTPSAGRYQTANSAGCRVGQACAAAVSLQTFQGGGMISSNRLLKVDPVQGRLVTSPNIVPSRMMQLPGPVISRPPVSQSLRAGAGTGMPATAPHNGIATFAPRSSVAVVAPKTVLVSPPKGFAVKAPPGMIFNTQSRRYERSYGPGIQRSTPMGIGARSSGSGVRAGGASAPRSEPSGGFGSPGGPGMGAGGRMGGTPQGPHR